MTPQIKTPVQIVQELIAIHTTRKEAGERLSSNQLTAVDSAKLVAAARKSEQFIKELMDELSTFGDAVQGDVDRENEYLDLWAKALANSDTMSGQESLQTFEHMESTLTGLYQQYLNIETELPVTLQEMLTRQAGELKQ